MKDKVLKTINEIRTALGYGKYLFSEDEFKYFIKMLNKEKWLETGCFRFEIIKDKLKIIPVFNFYIPLKEFKRDKK